MKCWPAWFRAAALRAVRTMAQAALAAIGSGAVFSQIHWPTVASTALLSGLLSVLTSLAGLPECKNEREDEEPPGGKIV